MISSSIRHSRSAQRRPWRSLSSNCSALARPSASAALSRCASNGAQFALATGVVLGEFFDLGGQRAHVDQIVRGPGGVFGRRASVVIEGEGSHKHPIAEAER